MDKRPLQEAMNVWCDFERWRRQGQFSEQRNQGSQKPGECMQVQVKGPEQLQRGNEDGKADPSGNKRGLDL